MIDSVDFNGKINIIY